MPESHRMLNRCPSCNASVLDDDAEVCPFCGSPMDPAKAKGFQPASKASQGGPAKPSPTAPAKPESRPTAATPGKKAAATGVAGKRPPAKDDDPFASDVAATSNAIPLSRKRTPQRPHQVVCPMCDTVGYAPVAASGKEVRCANADCLVPVFTAPDFAAPKPVEPEPKSSLGPTLLTFGAVAIILLGGAAFWWFGLRKEGRDSPVAVAVDSDPQPNPEQPVKPEETTPAPTAPAVPSPRESLAVALKELAESAEAVAQPQRQTLRRSYAAESYAMAGEIEASREQLQKMDLNRSSDPFYKIAPLAQLAWQHLSQNADAAAKAAFEELAPLANRIPRVGFDPARVAIDWSAVADRFGQEQAARDLVKTNRDDVQGEQLLALLRAAALFNNHDLHSEYPLRPLRLWSEPKSVGVTFDLLYRDADEQAQKWAAGFSDAVVRAENLAAWAEGRFVRDGVGSEQRVTTIRDAVADADPAERAFVLARATARAAALKDQAAAEPLLAAAVESAGEIPEPRAFAAEEMLDLYRSELPNQSAAHFQAAAFGELAYASSLVGQKDQAATFLSQALTSLAATVPASEVVDARQKELDSRGISGVASEFKQALNLASDDQAENAAVEYRRKLVELREAVTASEELRTELLARAVQWGLGSEVLSALKETAGTTGDAARLPSPLGGRLLGAAELAGDQRTAEEIRSLGVTNRDVVDLPAVELTVRSLVESGKLQDAGRQIYDSRWRRVNRSEKLSLAIRTACRIVAERSVADAFEFARAVGEEASREEVYRNFAAYAGHLGRGHEVIAALAKLRLSPTEQTALLRGLTEGLVALEATKPSVETASRSSASGA